MAAKAITFLVYLVGPWLLSGRFFWSLLLAGVIAGLSAIGYGWPTIQGLGVILLVAGFLRLSGVLPFLPA